VLRTRWRRDSITTRKETEQRRCWRRKSLCGWRMSSRLTGVEAKSSRDYGGERHHREEGEDGPETIVIAA